MAALLHHAADLLGTCWAPDIIYNYLYVYVKVTRHICFKNSKNLHPLDIMAWNSAIKPSFQNPTKKKAFCRTLKRWFISWITGLAQPLTWILKGKWKVPNAWLLFYRNDIPDMSVRDQVWFSRLHPRNRCDESTYVHIMFIRLPFNLVRI